jgi:hypothetical protein
MKQLGLVVILLGTASFAFAGSVTVPEIDANSAASAFALIGGGLLVLRARRNRRQK